MCQSKYYNCLPVAEKARPLFAIARGPYLQACEEVENQHHAVSIEPHEPHASITPEDIGARLSVNYEL